LSNAIKYTNTSWVKIHIKTHENPNWVLVEVSDSGIGISSADMNRLFKRFEQFDTASKDKIGHATGLGLAIVANVTQLLGGGISAKSTFGSGSCFRLLLPKAFFEEAAS